MDRAAQLALLQGLPDMKRQKTMSTKTGKHLDLMITLLLAEGHVRPWSQWPDPRLGLLQESEGDVVFHTKKFLPTRTNWRRMKIPRIPRIPRRRKKWFTTMMCTQRKK
jgi:hypothetical protein